jgi:Kef-type K+ transport system membrane component KefB/voltage-gated potassium channel Kch
MHASIFTELAVVVTIVVFVSAIMKLLRQPLIMGYIITGVLVGPSFSFFHITRNQSAFDSFSSIGITLLLFIIGLGLNAGVIKSLGRVSIVTSMSILPFLGLLSFGACWLLGFDLQTSIITAMALFFSSTIIVLKTLSDEKQTTRLFGQITLGILLIEDVIATGAVVVLAMMASPGNGSAEGWQILLKALALGAGLFLAGRYLMPHIARFAAKSQELLFLFSLSWGLAVATLFDIAGFSHEVGALFAGVSLAGLPYATEMAAKLKPLRDFFIVIFFVTLGESFTLDSIGKNLLAAHVLAAIVIVGKPLLVMLSLGIQRYTKLTSFKAAVHLSQISEFSIIFITIAASKGLIGQDQVALITLTAFITIGVSSYLMKHADGLYKILEKPLRHIERSTAHEPKKRAVYYPVILVGYHKGGHEFLRTFRDMNQKYLVVDYDPEIIESLEEQGVRHAYGDATDEEFLDEINAGRAQMIVSTMTDIETNRSLLQYIRRHNQKSSFICHANNYAEAALLYEHGASYVTLPHYIGSERVSSFIKRHGIDHEALANYRDKHLITIGRQALKA